MEQLDLFAQPEDDVDDEYEPYDRPAPRPRPALALAPQPEPKPASPSANRYPLPFGTNRVDAARRIAEAATDAWHQHHGGGRMEIPVGVVAALSLWPLKGPDAPLQADFILGLDGPDLCKLLSECWAYWWTRRPDLVHRAAPIARWLEEDLSGHHHECVRAVARGAIRSGLLTLTGSMDPYDLAEVDLMSWMVTGLRSHSSMKWLGEYHTPPEMCEVMARVTLDDCSQVKPGYSFADPAGGTGGMIRAAAQLLREHGIDPATCRWHVAELDPISAAGAAVNMLLWGMGPHTTVWCGDTLAQGDTERLALEEKRGAFEHRDKVVTAGALAAAVGKAHRLLSGVKTERLAA